MKKYIRTYTVYGLSIKGSKRFFYIGVTGKTPYDRALGHYARCSLGLETNKDKEEILLSSKIEVFTIEGGIKTRSTAFKREKYWITYYGNEGHPLTNRAHHGGKNGLSLTKRSNAIWEYFDTHKGLHISKLARQADYSPQNFVKYMRERKRLPEQLLLKVEAILANYGLNV